MVFFLPFLVFFIKFLMQNYFGLAFIIILIDSFKQYFYYTLPLNIKIEVSYNKWKYHLFYSLCIGE